jgi:hypothetical protein
MIWARRSAKVLSTLSGKNWVALWDSTTKYQVQELTRQVTRITVPRILSALKLCSLPLWKLSQTEVMRELAQVSTLHLVLVRTTLNETMPTKMVARDGAMTNVAEWKMQQQRSSPVQIVTTCKM